jgi:hypothetical protein
LVLDTVDEPIRKVSTKSLIKWDAELLFKSLLESPGVDVWSGTGTLFNNLTQGMGSSNYIIE